MVERLHQARCFKEWCAKSGFALCARGLVGEVQAGPGSIQAVSQHGSFAVALAVQKPEAFA